MLKKTSDIFKNKNFFLLFSGETISNVGDQFTFIALAWLVVKLSGSGLELGGVLALAGVPRAAMMLLGGAVCDKFSSRLVMIISNFVRLGVSSALAVLALTGHIHMYEVYVLAFAFGVADAFFIPAQTSIVPRIVEKKQLRLANTLVQGSIQISQFIGPVLAGVIIAAADQANTLLHGVGIAFAVDAATFIISIVTLVFIKQKQAIYSEEGIWQSIKLGLSAAWQDKGLRYILFMIAAVNFLMFGPFLVGIPLICEKLPGGAGSYGLIMGVWGLGIVLGYIFTNIFPLKDINRMTQNLSYCVIVMGICLSLLLWWVNLYSIIAFSLIVAVLAGYMAISFLTIIQQVISERIMGRIMSILMLCTVGLVPLSEVAAGALMPFGLRNVFMASGILTILIGYGSVRIADVKTYGQRLNAQTAKE